MIRKGSFNQLAGNGDAVNDSGEAKGSNDSNIGKDGGQIGRTQYPELFSNQQITDQ